MAHVGKLWPLLFRRDICLGCSNHRFAYPRHFVITYRFRVLSSPQVLYENLSGVPCRLTTSDDTVDPEWSTDPITENGRTWRFQMSGREWDFSRQKNLLTLRAMNGEDLVGQQGLENLIQGRCYHMSQGLVGMSHWDADFWDGPAAPHFGINTFGLPWSEL